MECPLMWTILSITIILSLNVSSLSGQHQTASNSNLIPQTGLILYPEVAKEHSNPNNPSPTPQLMNTLLTIAAANGVLPELLPKIQPLRITAEAPSGQEVEQITAAHMQQSAALRQHEQFLPHMVSTDPQYTHMVPKHVPTAYETMAPKQVPIVQPIVISPGLQTNPVAQQNPFIPRNLEASQSHPPQLVQPKEELCFCSEHIPTSAQIPSNPPIVLNTFDNSMLNLEPQCANSILTTENGFQYPVNLQISIPPPNVEAPRITFINAALPTPSVGSYAPTDVNAVPYNSWFPYGYTSQPQPQQVIVRKRKSSLKEWLPLIIYSMFHNDRGSCNNGGCCCQCESRSGTVPIPFPIPIPTNNPIITTRHSYSNSSHHSGSKHDSCDD